MPNDTQGDEELSIVLTNAAPQDGGDGPRDVEFDSDDIVEPVIQRIGDYLARETREAGNQFPVLEGEPAFVSYRDGNGNPAALTPAGGDDNTFVGQVGQSSQGADAVTHFNQTSNTRLFSFNVLKGKTSGTDGLPRDGLYFQIDNNDPEPILTEDVTRILEENSRFSEDSPYVDPDASTESEAGTKDFIPQQSFGRHSPQKWPATDEAPTPVTIQNLKNLGLQTMLAASGEALVPDDPSNSGQLAGALATVNTVPGLARLGQRVNYGRFRSGNIMEDVNSDYSKPKISDLEGDGPEKLSYGSPNNPLVPFAKLNNTSSQLAASLLVLTVSAMVKALGEVLKNSQAVKLSDPASNDITANRLGSYRGQARTGLGTSGTRSATQNTTSFILLYETRNEYSACIEAGLETFFDLQDGNPGFTLNTFEQPGYYNTILRSMLRDTTDILVDGVAGVATNPFGSFSTRGSLEVGNETNGVANPLGFINSAVGLLENLRDSRLLKFMNILAKIGDLTLLVQEPGFSSVIDSVKDSTTDQDFENTFQTNINQAALIRKNRLSDRVRGLKQGSLAMASNTVLSMYSLPRTFEQAEHDLTGETRASSTLLNSFIGFRSTQGTNRLSKEDVDAFEREMDAYYVPFYFQDLRTNEMIAFHAFLEDIKDGFSADYNETEGFGRLGKHMSYRNTERTISFSFHVVSTNHNDFDEMWLKINKLVTLVYPQYTLGRNVVDERSGDSFIQPFSQLISASPLIRLRIGDLIKSNLSDIDIARLFGAGSEQFVINQESGDISEARRNNISSKVAAITERQQRGEFQVNDTFYLNSAQQLEILPPATDSRQGSSLGTDDGSDSTQTRGRGRRNRRTRGRESASTLAIANGTRLRVIGKRSAPASNASGNEETTSRVYYAVRPEPQPAGANPADQFVIGINPRNVNEMVRLDTDAIYAQARQDPGGANTPELQAGQSRLENVQAFFSPEGDDGNPVFKAFESTKGQGLAGFVKSIQFDWEQAVWETEGINARAPKFMKINIDFAPIHDINPGLGHDGFMIGSIYNVGDIMRRLKNKRISQIEENPYVTRVNESIPESDDGES